MREELEGFLRHHLLDEQTPADVHGKAFFHWIGLWNRTFPDRAYEINDVVIYRPGDTRFYTSNERRLVVELSHHGYIEAISIG